MSMIDTKPAHKDLSRYTSTRSAENEFAESHIDPKTLTQDYDVSVPF